MLANVVIIITTISVLCMRKLNAEHVCLMHNTYGLFFPFKKRLQIELHQIRVCQQWP